MLTHIHPSLRWFTCESRSIFNGIVYPGSVSRTSQDPPRAQSPFARWRRYLHRRDVHAPRQRALPLLLRSYGLMRQTKTLPSYSITLLGGSLQVVASPCWEMVLPDVISAILAQVPGPLPRDASLVPLSVSSQRVPASPPLHQVRRIQQPPQCHFNDDPIFEAAVIPLCSGSHAC